MTSTPFQVDGQPTGPSAGAPHRIGEHTRQVLGEVLGYDSARIEELAKAGAIGWCDPPRRDEEARCCSW